MEDKKLKFEEITHQTNRRAMLWGCSLLQIKSVWIEKQMK